MMIVIKTVMVNDGDDDDVNKRSRVYRRRGGALISVQMCVNCVCST